GAWLDEQIQVLQQEMACRRALYAADDGSLVPPLDGATAIIVDDGIATGNTMRAALAAVAEEHPARVLFAAPVGAPDMVQALQAQAEGLCLAAPDDFHAVSPYYTDFTQTTDEEVVRLLAQSRAGLAATQKESRMKKISDLMTRDVATVSPQDSLQRAAQLMKECDVGALPVCDGQTLVGMITDRDITVRASADGQAPDNVKVGEVMSEGITYCFEDQDVEEVLQQMGTEQVRRLPVLTRDKRLCGMVALGDIATRDQTHTDSALEGISQPPAGGQQGAQGESPSRPS
ncbi:MAG TPA: CBS domain-containing protein, partial [Noviherbaspirillum sp.]|nr:CBS domain-containing protein [Noviherbaspirillum sp.]